MKRIFAFSIVLLFAVVAPGQVRIQGFPSVYYQITDAVHYAIGGDTLLIATGVYNEVVNIYGKDLTLDGGYTNDFASKVSGGRSVIDGSTLAAGSVLNITGSVVNLNTVDLRGGEWGAFHLVGNGGGLDIRDGSRVTATNCAIYDNYSRGKGGGVYVLDSSLSLYDTRVHTNRARVTLLPDGGEAIGGGIYVENGTLELNGASVVSNNWAQHEGGGIYARTSSVNVIHTSADIMGNVASNGAGIAMDGGTLRIQSGADVAGNVAEGRGGGILLMGGSTGVISGSGTSIGFNSDILGANRVTNGVGGGICVVDSTLILTNSARVAHNSAIESGGGIYATNGVCELRDAYVGWGAGHTNLAFNGGGIAVFESTLSLAGATRVQGGRAILGGGIVARDSVVTVGPDAVIGGSDSNLANQAWGGGGVFAIDSRVELRGEVWNNMAMLGGGGGIGLDNCELKLYSARVVGNAANSLGGGIYCVNGSNEFMNAYVISNTASYGGGIALQGPMDTLFWLTNSITHNRATVMGGGIYCNSTNVIDIQRTYLIDNSAGTHGGGLAVVTGRVAFGNGDIARNTAAGRGGGVYVSNAWVTLYNGDASLYLNYNQARNGGGIAVEGRGGVSAFAVSNLYVTVNIATNSGGGVWVNNGTFSASGRMNIGGNWADESGGGAYADEGAYFFMEPQYGGNPHVYNNTARRSGGGLCVTGSTSQVRLRNARVGLGPSGWPNPNFARGTGIDDGGGGIAVLADGRCDLESTWIVHNVSSNFGGGINVDGGLLNVMGNYADLTPGQFRPPNFIFDNSAPAQDGGGICVIRSTIHVRDVLIQSNRASRGGGLYCDSSSTAKVMNAVFVQNAATSTGGAVRASFSSRAELLNCTVITNSAGGVVSFGSGALSLTNCIVGWNESIQIAPGHEVGYCNVQDGYAGPGNVDVDPLFIFSAPEDVRLGYGSPCADAGTTLASVTTDAIGEPRPFGVAYDMGAYEYNRETYDTDIDGIPDGWEADRGLNPRNPADALANYDSDPYINREEYIADTDPFDGDDYLRIVSIDEAAERRIGFPSSANRLYTLYATPRMTNDAAWTFVGTNVNFYGSGGLCTATDTNRPMRQGFYRVDVKVP